MGSRSGKGKPARGVKGCGHSPTRGAGFQHHVALVGDREVRMPANKSGDGARVWEWQVKVSMLGSPGISRAHAQR